MAIMGPLAPGHKLQGGCYTILSLVGQGGMGYVYTASDRSQDNIIVAIKEMKQNDLTSEGLQEAIRLFQQEATMLKKLTPHPHIPQYYNFFADQGRYFIVMAYIEGPTLEGMIGNSQGHQIPVENVLYYGWQLCRVLSYLHQQSPPVILRDLKPANVKVMVNGHIYLLDFGIARHYKPGQAMDTTIRLTKGYAAPEAVLEQTEPLCDLYSLGVVLHHCLTGRSPLDNRTPFQFPSVRQFNLQVPPVLDNLIQQLLKNHKEERPQSASIVLQELEAIKNRSADYTQSPTQPQPPTIRQTSSLLPLLRLCLATSLLCLSKLGTWAEVTLIPWIVVCAQKLWQFVSNKRQAFLAYRRQLKAKRAALLPKSANPPSPAPQPKKHGELVHVILRKNGTMAHYIHDIKAMLEPQAGPAPNLVPFAGVFAIIVSICISMLALLHLSPYVVLFMLATILLLISFSACVQRNIDGSVQNIFAATMIAMLLVCITLAILPDVKQMLASITVNLLLCFLIGALGLTSLLRSARRNMWVDQMTIIAIAIAAAMQQYVLAPQELQLLWPSIASPAFVEAPGYISIIASLVIIGLVGLALLRKGYLHSISFIAVSCILLQFTLGEQDLPIPVQKVTHPNITLFIWIFTGVLLGSIMLARFSLTRAKVQNAGRIPWERLGRLPLVFVVILCLLLQYNLGIAHTPQSMGGITDFLHTRPLDPTRIEQSAISLLLLLLATILLLSWFRRSSYLLINTLASVGIGIICTLLPATLRENNSSLVSLLFNTNVILALELLVAITLLLLVCSSVVHLFPKAWLQIRVDQLLRTSGYAILTLSASFCTLFLWSYANELPLQQLSLQMQELKYQLAQQTVIYIGIVAVIEAIMTIYSLFQLLSEPPTTDDAQNAGIPPQQRGGKFVPILNGILLSLLVGYLLEITWDSWDTWNIQGWQQVMYPVLPSLLAWKYTPMLLWLVVFGLLIFAGLSFFTIQPGFEQLKHITIKTLLVIALICIAIAAACTVIVAASTVIAAWKVLLPITAYLFAITVITGLILLIQTILLLTWSAKEVWSEKTD